MKLDITKNILKRGLLYSGITLMCLSTSGCKQLEESDKNDVDTTDISVYELDDNDNKEFNVSLDNDTMKILNKYNEYLGEKKLDINDLEILSMYNVSMFALKLEDGSFRQIGDDYCVAIKENGDINLLLSEKVEEAKYDMLTGKKLKDNTEYVDYIPVIKYMVDNNIELVGYTLPKSVSYSNPDINMIENIYGEEVTDCVKQLGIPLKVYDSKDFYQVKEDSKINIKK